MLGSITRRAIAYDCDPQEYLHRLCDAELLVSEPFISDHAAFPDGVTIAKPAAIKGHSLPEYKAWWDVDGPVLDAPSLFLHANSGRWFVTSHDYVPGPGPGDFVNDWATPEEAIADVLDFYFGSPTRMNAKHRR